MEGGRWLYLKLATTRIIIASARPHQSPRQKERIALFVTTTKPTGTNAIQNLGIIIKVNTGGNKISGIIMGAGRANDVPNIPQGQTWIGNASGVATPTTLAAVATSGAYSDLSGTPTIPTGELVDDTTPQLGGDLDVNGKKFVSTANGDIVFDPD